MAGFPQKDQPRNAQAPSIALDRRQLHDSQIPPSEGVAGKTRTLPYAFHTDIQVVDEHDRAFFGDITVYVRDGSFGSVRELKASMTTFLARRYAQPSRCSGQMKPDTPLGENARHNEMSDDQNDHYIQPRLKDVPKGKTIARKINRHQLWRYLVTPKPPRTNLRFQTLLHAYLRHRAWSRGGCFHCEK